MSTSARDVLYGSAEDGQKDLSHQLAGAPVLEKASHFLPVEDLISSLLDSLDIPLKDMAFLAWDRHTALMRAKANTKGKPGASEIVRLAQHEITSTHRPRIEIYVGPKTALKIDLALTVTLTIDTVAITVAEGRIVEIGPAMTMTRATLSVEGQKVADRKLPDVALPRYLWSALWSKGEWLEEPQDASLVPH